MSVNCGQSYKQVEPMQTSIATIPASPPLLVKKPFYFSLSFQVSAGVVLAIAFGYFFPSRAVAMKPLGDVFIRLITMIITLVIFCTLVTGIAGMEDLKKVGRVGGKALLYFEIISTIALLIGLAVGNLVRPGSGFNVDPSTLDVSAVAQYAGATKSQSAVDFIAHIVPSTVVDAFARGDILQVLFISLLFGFGLSLAGPRCKPLLALLDAMTAAVFRVVALLMRVAPIGAFGAMAFTVGKYGLASLRPLLQLTLTLYITSFLFIVLVLGLVARVAGFGILRLLWFLREEIIVVLATSSSEPVLPSLMAKLEKLGCSKALVGLVVPTGYTFNADGTSLYMTLAALFVAQATNAHLTLMQQLTILGIALLTSKGASGVQGAAFVALVATLMVIPTVPVAGMALILGIDRFLSMCRAVVNMIGNAIATLVVARWESELDVDALRQRLR
jgi:aerobic C4-dicarboxylate transport protein